MSTEPADTGRNINGSVPEKENKDSSASPSQDAFSAMYKQSLKDRAKIAELEKSIDNLKTYYGELVSYFQKEQKKLDLSFSKKIDELDEQISSKQREFKDQVEKDFNKLDSDKIRIIEVVGVFLALLTFVSVEFQILPKADNFFELAGLSVLLFAGLSLFVAVLVQVCESWLNQEREYSLYKNNFINVAAFLVLLGVVLGGIGYCLESEYKCLAAKQESKVETDVMVNSSNSTPAIVASSTVTTTTTTEQ